MECCRNVVRLDRANPVAAASSRSRGKVMKFQELFSFEFAYPLRRVSTCLYFAVLVDYEPWDRCLRAWVQAFSEHLDVEMGLEGHASKTGRATFFALDSCLLF